MSDLKGMKKAGRGGVIVNMASVLALVGFGTSPAYTAAKRVSPAFISDEAGFLTGGTYLVDGGYTAP